MIEYIIVQAGGKGSRMEYLTANKPKCLIAVNHLPMLFHLFEKYPDKKFIIIGDYKFEVLKEYLKSFAKVSYMLVDARGYNGTCAGLRQAAALMKEQQGFMLIWSDLILSKEYMVPKEDGDYIGLSGDFKCRWKYENGNFYEECSIKQGVAGVFLFHNKDILKDIPDNGEFVSWLKEKNIKLKVQLLSKTKEYGCLIDYKKLKQRKCRPFNQITVQGRTIIKESVDEQGKQLAIQEKAWYEHAKLLGYHKIPQIYSYQPFIMEKINGKNIYEYFDLSLTEKERILINIIENLKKLHNLEKYEVDYFSIKENYLDKTFLRLSCIRDLIPFANEKYIRINGRNCRNIFFFQKELEQRLSEYKTKEFCFIHGDCTFSNMMLKDDAIPILIDPRGYFGKTKLFGDPVYDWAKLYYSLIGNYDQFNLKKFQLNIGKKEINLEIDSNRWEKLECIFFEQLKDEVKEEDIKLLHSIIWLSLTTYTWEDYDSICGAFYIGLYYLEEVL